MLRTKGYEFIFDQLAVAFFCAKIVVRALTLLIETSEACTWLMAIGTNELFATEYSISYTLKIIIRVKVDFWSPNSTEFMCIDHLSTILDRTIDGTKNFTEIF